MKRKYITYLLMIIVFTGCTKQLEQVNPNLQTAESFWRNQDDAIKGLNAAYGSLIVDGTYMRFTPLLLDIRGDDIRSNSPWSQIYNIGRFALGTSIGDGYGWAFESYYQGVFRSNQVLDNVPGITMNEDVKKRIIGQAHFLRGLYFFHLVNLFGNVSLPLSAPKTPDEFNSPQRTQAEGWTQVINDLKRASELLPNSYVGVVGPDNNQVGRATKGAALAYLGKAYLFNKRYQEAADAFAAVIAIPGYDLMANYADNFTEAFENNKESVFEVQFSRDAGGLDLGWGGAPSPTWGRTSARAITYAPRSFGWTDAQPTFSLFNEFMQEQTTGGQVDPRLDATVFYNKPGGMPMYQTTFQARYAGNPADLNDLFCKKYQNSGGHRPDEFDWRSGINERIMRFSDVLLMYAECLNELSQTAAAYAPIQRVRDRVGLPNLAITRPGMTQAQMRDQIAHERLLEFCLEGHRFDDIRRWGWLQDPVKLAALKVRDPEFNSYQPGRELYPIPLVEIQNNPGYVQNPTY